MVCIRDLSILFFNEEKVLLQLSYKIDLHCIDTDGCGFCPVPPVH